MSTNKFKFALLRALTFVKPLFGVIWKFFSILWKIICVIAHAISFFYGKFNALKIFKIRVSKVVLLLGIIAAIIFIPYYSYFWMIDKPVDISDISPPPPFGYWLFGLVLLIYHAGKIFLYIAGVIVAIAIGATVLIHVISDVIKCAISFKNWITNWITT